VSDSVNAINGREKDRQGRARGRGRKRKTKKRLLKKERNHRPADYKEWNREKLRRRKL
jgi:hypothetical protein